ncbi:uncharacterized protein BKA55DRAFT_539257 [Fusarium redolens]|uniref:Uncharacterized protein n=1 Tax=Fusarium redolens TaxID=48865 RepID=A0A9P9H1Z5_FUSRE|nr:uncharacterized protein BKA55DRAFT_539257 [Fusarium redolens]KAH7249679.1 hypothetical protein BKA55DRAFT_539257 [Fusarium redolens]
MYVLHLYLLSSPRVPTYPSPLAVIEKLVTGVSLQFVLELLWQRLSGSSTGYHRLIRLRRCLAGQGSTGSDIYVLRTMASGQNDYKKQRLGQTGGNTWDVVLRRLGLDRIHVSSRGFNDSSPYELDTIQYALSITINGTHFSRAQSFEVSDKNIMIASSSLTQTPYITTPT